MGNSAGSLKEPGAAAIRLLLDILDQPEPILSGQVVADHFPNAGRALIAAGLLVPDGYEMVDASGEDDDAMVSVHRAEDGEGFAFVHPMAGVVSVDPQRLTRYRASPQAIATALLASERTAARTGLTVFSHEIWDLGDVRVRSRTHRVPVILVRRAHVSRRWKETRKWLVRNPPPRTRVVLGIAPADRLPDDDCPAGNVLVSLRDVLAGDGSLRLNSNSLAARLDSRPFARPTDELLVVRAEGQEVVLKGVTYRLPKGVQQRRIIRALHAWYQDGVQEVAVSTLVTELDLRSDARIRDYFKKCNPPVMGKLLWERGGMCGFCLN